jgi:hypothetical protein
MLFLGTIDLEGKTVSGNGLENTLLNGITDEDTGDTRMLRGPLAQIGKKALETPFFTTAKSINLI